MIALVSLASHLSLTLGWSAWINRIVTLLLVVAAILLILTILIQRPQGGGLSGAFGSAGSGQTAFGAKTGDALTFFTIGMFVVFVILASVLSIGGRPEAPIMITPQAESKSGTGQPTPTNEGPATGSEPTSTIPAGDAPGFGQEGTPNAPSSSGPAAQPEGVPPATPPAEPAPK